MSLTVAVYIRLFEFLGEFCASVVQRYEKIQTRSWWPNVVYTDRLDAFEVSSFGVVLHMT